MFLPTVPGFILVLPPNLHLLHTVTPKTFISFYVYFRKQTFIVCIPIIAPKIVSISYLIASKTDNR